jgi:hypothetical protein
MRFLILLCVLLTQLPARQKDFPGKELNRLLDEADYAYDLKKQREQIARILRPGVYRFGSACPLVKISESNEILYHEWPIYQAKCLDPALRKLLAIPVTVDRSNKAWKLLYKAKAGIELTAILELKNSGEVYHAAEWTWIERKIYFKNPILTALSGRLKEVPFDEVLGPQHLSHELGVILDSASRSGNAQYLAEILRPGLEIQFGKNCPLLVAKAPEKQSNGNLGLHLRISCHKGRYQNIFLQLTSGFLDKFAHISFTPGQRLAALLEFSRIVENGGQHQIVWDSIINVQAL